MIASDACPCGSGTGCPDCCGRFHAGAAHPVTAQDLMRSRYCAFAVRDEAYLERTWHPSTRPARIGLDETIRWTRLRIVDLLAGGAGDPTGVVEFRAHYRRGGEPHVLHERSTFARVDGRWVYVSGEEPG